LYYFGYKAKNVSTFVVQYAINLCILMKNKIILFITGCFTLLLASCLDSDDSSTVSAPRDAQISSFSLSHDSIAGLSKVKFTIDQLNGQIFNKDSMPYGTKVGKVICNMTYRSSALTAAITQDAYPDSMFYWKEGDSIDFSKPVKIVVTALDRVMTKTYTAKVNIRQVNPDSMLWTLYASNPIPETIREQKVVVYPYNNTDAYFMYVKTNSSYKLYYSALSDAANWNELPLTGLTGDLLITQIALLDGYLYVPSESGMLYRSADGLNWMLANNAPSVKSVLGVLKEGREQIPLLATIVEQNGTLHFAGMDANQEWTIGEQVYAKFPVVNFATTQYANMYHSYLMAIGGRDKDNQLTNTVWATMNATDWVLLTNENRDYFEKKEGAILTRYDDKIFLAGGINAEGKASKEIHVSKDYGVTWTLQDSLKAFPSGYKARGFASVQVDTNNYMLIFGGKTSKNAESLNEIWRGRINRLSL
jgi:hypothetical protein